MGKIVKIIKKIKIKNIIILILLLIFNTYAWFVYATKVSSGLSVHVSSWNVEFSTGDNETTTNIVIEVERVYPGMDTFEKNITVKNKGEIKAELEYNILSKEQKKEINRVYRFAKKNNRKYLYKERIKFIMRREL